ncbi:MAG: TolC family protein [Pirellulaceae bacterium]
MRDSAGADEVLPVPGGVSGLTIDQAIAFCLTNDPQLQAGMTLIQQMHGDARTASLLPNPELVVAAGLLPLDRRFTPEAPAGPSEFDVEMAYPVDWFLFGKRAAAIASAEIGVGISEAEFADLVRRRATDTALAFYDVLEAKDLLRLAKLDVENLERVEVVTQRAVENGGRPQVELSRVRLDMLARRREFRDAELASIASTAQLRATIGAMDADAGFEVVGTLNGSLTAEPLPVEQALAIAQQNRPDLLALRRKVAQAQAEVVVTRRNAWPTVTSDFGLAHQYQESIGAPDATMWGTGLTMSVPLFDRNQGNRAKAAAVVSQNAAELRAGLVELRAEIVEAVQSLNTAQQNASSVAQEELRLAARVRDSIGQAYEAGGRPLIDVLDAQRNFRETYRIYITNRAEYWRSLYRYNSALGEQVAR